MFTIVYLKQTVSLGCTVLWLFCSYAVWHVQWYAPWWMFCTFALALSAVCVQCPVWLYCVVPCFGALPVCCSGIVWIILGWFQLPLLLLVSLFFYIQRTLCFHSNVLVFYNVLVFAVAHMCLSWNCNVYKHTWSFYNITCSDVEFIVRNGSVGYLTLPSWLVSTDLAHAPASVPCPVLPVFPLILYSVIEHTLYQFSLCIVLLPVLGMLV